MATPYDPTSIRVLSTIDAVRLRPGMYVGDIDDGSGMHQLLWEVVGNAIDEHLAGHASYVRVRFDDAWVSVEDDGRGIPVDVLPQLGISALEAVLTQLHGSGPWRRHHVHLAHAFHGLGLAP